MKLWFLLLAILMTSSCDLLSKGSSSGQLVETQCECACTEDDAYFRSKANRIDAKEESEESSTSKVPAP